MSAPVSGLRFGSRRRSPDACGYRLPAEWEPHRATWLTWPHNRADWEIKTSAVEWCYVEMVRNLVDGERVAILFRDAAVERRARACLRRAGVDTHRVEPYRIRTNRSWIRDYGPIFVVRGQSPTRSAVAVTDWGFTGWARYRAYAHDSAVPAAIARRRHRSRFAIQVDGRPVVLEGGAIDGNGRGLLLTTEECLLSPVQARNPGLTRTELEAIFAAAFGVRRVLWLGGGIAGDDTHGHVDDIARFVSPTTIVAAEERDPMDVNYRTLQDNLERLRRLRDLRGRPFRIVAIPMPRPQYFDGARLPASYLNFYIANRRVLVPTFNDPLDHDVLHRLSALFPTRQVVGIHATDLILGLGAVHCLTQQEPAASPRP